VSLYGLIKQANQPGAPENSITFRVAATGSVIVAIAACWAQAELPGWITAGSIALVVIGNVFSYLRRNNPFPFLKVVLALAVVISFLWFFATIAKTASAGDLASVEGPLAILFTIIQATHAFDVPSRRDLGFSVAGSATLMAVAAAQAVNTTFALYVVAWAGFGLIALLAMWSSMAGGGPIRVRTVVLSALGVVVVGTGIVAVLPAPHAASNLVFPSAIAGDAAVNEPAGLVGAGPKGNEPVHAGSPSGATRVGGFLGFSGPLDTAIRGSLGNQVVFRVRADRPSFWVAETFDQWDGQSWAATPPPAGTSQWRELVSGPPFDVPLPSGEAPQGAPDYQTFYLAVAGPNLVFHAANANEVWFPAHRLFVASDGTIRAGTSMGPGSIYTVLSTVNTATPTQLAGASTNSPVPGGQLTASEQARYLRLPHPYPQVAALATRITAGSPTTYAKILALEHWIATHTTYTTDIPALKPGQDTVDEFLFHSRRGYCEQISTALSVMLRSIGIPSREAVGYVPGPYNPLTDLYEVQAKDAHAWVQVWFPGYGWQSFDPTALVPNANPTPADAIGHDLSGLVRSVPPIPVAVVTGLLALVLSIVVILRRRPTSWAGAIAQQIDKAARRAGLDAKVGEPLLVLAARLDACWPPADGPPAPSAVALASAAERAAYLGVQPDRAEQRRLLAGARRLRRAPRSERAGPVNSGQEPGLRSDSPRQPAEVGRP